jgi:hypothetical protein
MISAHGMAMGLGSKRLACRAAGLDEMTWQALAAHRGGLLAAIGAAEPLTPDVAARALELAVLITEQDMRARTYSQFAGTRYACACGFSCEGLAALDDHLDGFWDDETHYEVSGGQV